MGSLLWCFIGGNDLWGIGNMMNSASSLGHEIYDKQVNGNTVYTNDEGIGVQHNAKTQKHL